MSCPHRFDVEVYVLGALDPSERGAFEEHLTACAECRGALTENAALPGILARAPEPGTSGADAAVPAAVLSGALGRVRRRRRAGRLLAVSAVLVALGGGLAVGDVVLGGSTAAGDGSSAAGASGDGSSGDGSSGAVTAREVSLPGVGASPSSGLAGLTARPWGTEVALRCRTLRATSPAAPAPAPVPTGTRAVYVLVVVSTDGGQQEIARWSPPPGQDVSVAASTDLPEDRVAGLEVRTGSGQVVMRS